ncbi:MAG: hypothetical protein HS122_02390 [Opitutaceae bacterium]|nr:hypothetical protein [Opitutaceae bacterium]
MHQWDIVRVRINPKDRDAHPAIVISCEEDCQDAEFLRINVLYGTKRVPAAPLDPWQVLLNGADGLEFQTAVDCGIFYLVPKASCSPAIGTVGLERRRQIGRKINEVLRLPR